MEQKIRQRTAWFREQWRDGRFRIFSFLALAAGIGLTAEFALFSYSIWKILRYLILFASLFLIAWIDQKNKRIPNRILKFLLAVRAALLIPEWLTFPDLGTALLISALLGALLGGGLLLFAHLLSKGGLGMGDVKLFAVIGAYLGSGSIMSAVFLSVMSSAVYSAAMLIVKKIKLKEEIPFAPFIFIGIILTMALGM